MGSTSTWRSVMHHVSQMSSNTRSNTTHVCISDMELGLSALPAGLQMMLSGAADLCEWGNAIQGGPYRLEEWLPVNIMKFNRPNTRFCTWAETAYRQGHKWIKSIPVRKDMGIMVSEKLNTNFPCGQKANYIVCFVKRKAWSAGQGRWFSPLCSALVTTPLQQCIELGGSQQKL